MNFTEYQKLASSTAIYPKKYETIYPALGLCGEAGEVVQDKELSDGGLSHLTVEELEKIERIHEIASSRSGSGENGIGNKAVS